MKQLLWLRIFHSMEIDIFVRRYALLVMLVIQEKQEAVSYRSNRGMSTM